MKRTLIVSMVTALALPVLAQDGHITFSTADGKSVGAIGTSGGGQVVSAFGHAMQGGTAALLSSAQDVLRANVGGIPPAYAILGLTDEQNKTIEGLLKEARAEYNQTYTSMAGGVRGQTSPEDFQKRVAERREKQAAISARYDTRMTDVLTADQKSLLAKIKALAEQKNAEDKKIAETASAAYKDVLETYKKKLYAILPPDQAKKVEADDQTRSQNAGGGGTAPRAIVPGQAAGR